MTARGGERDETGASLIMAVVVMMVLTTLTTALLARTLSVMAAIRTGQNFDAALAVADAGLSDALFQIDQTAPNDFTWQGTAGAGSYDYFADKVSDTEYVVTSVGTLGNSRHAIQATIKRGARFPYALWSNQPMHFSGTTSLAMRIGFYAFNQLPGDPNTVRIGSNAYVDCNGPVDPEVYIDQWDGESECDSEHITKLADARDMSYTVPTSPVQPCPAGGIFGIAGTTASNPVLLDGSGGPFVCERNVTLLGHLGVVNGPVQIYIKSTRDSSGNVVASYSLDMSLAVVNVASGASQFQLYKEGAAPINIGSGNTSNTMTYRGVLWAPDSTLTINGGLWWAGSINVNNLAINGSPNLIFGYDWDLGHYLGKDWKLARYREIAGAQGAAIVDAASTPVPPPPPPPPPPDESTTTTTMVPELPTTTTTTITVPELPTTTSTSTSTTSTSTTSTTALTLPTLPLP